MLLLFFNVGQSHEQIHFTEITLCIVWKTDWKDRLKSNLVVQDTYKICILLAKQHHL